MLCTMVITTTASWIAPQLARSQDSTTTVRQASSLFSSNLIRIFHGAYTTEARRGSRSFVVCISQ